LAAADEPAPSSDRPLLSLSYEVQALQTLYLLDLSRPQLEALRQLGKDTADRTPLKSAPAHSEEMRKLLLQLRQAFIADEQERITKLAQRLEELRNGNSDFDDQIGLSDDAIERAPIALKLLTPKQAAAYLGSVADDIPDPTGGLLEALEKVRKLPADKVADYRLDVADEVAQALAGFDSDRAAEINNQAVQLLIIASSYKDDEFKKHRAELEAKARRIVGSSGPTDVLHNVMEHALAELLSNPELPAAIDGRLKAVRQARK
jgi:hypothetical protein